MRSFYFLLSLFVGMYQVQAQTYTSLKDALANPRAVKVLDLTNQYIEEIPSDIKRMENMVRLVLKDNRLKTLPSEISKLPNFKIAYALDFLNKETEALNYYQKIDSSDINYNFAQRL
ncbi:MAG: hypothetical protein ACKVTZ_21105, partial [Bacteroidia bacterium]